MTLPDQSLLPQAQVEQDWGRDVVSLQDCRKRLAAVVSFYRSRDAAIRAAK